MKDKSQSVYELESGSGLEIVVNTISAFLLVGYLWVLAYRYSKLSEKGLSRLEKGIVIVLTAVVILGSINNLVSYLCI